MDLINFPSECVYLDQDSDGKPWNGEASLKDQTLKISVKKKANMGENGCGTCFYIWSFEMEEMATHRPTDLKIDAGGNYSLSLPTIGQNEGQICKYIDANRPYASGEWFSL